MLLLLLLFQVVHLVHDSYIDFSWNDEAGRLVVRPFPTRIFFQELFELEGSKQFLEKNRQVHNLKISDRLLRCVCVFSSHPFWTSSSLDVPAGVTQEEVTQDF